MHAWILYTIYVTLFHWQYVGEPQQPYPQAYPVMCIADTDPYPSQPPPSYNALYSPKVPDQQAVQVSKQPFN